MFQRSVDTALSRFYDDGLRLKHDNLRLIFVRPYIFVFDCTKCIRTSASFQNYSAEST
jgi:hypothetical protein